MAYNTGSRVDERTLAFAPGTPAVLDGARVQVLAIAPERNGRLHVRALESCGEIVAGAVYSVYPNALEQVGG